MNEGLSLRFRVELGSTIQHNVCGRITPSATLRPFHFNAYVEQYYDCICMCRMRTVAYCINGDLFRLASLLPVWLAWGVLVVSLASGLLSLVFFVKILNRKSTK